MSLTLDQIPPTSGPLKVAVLGNVDSAKSTLIGVLISGEKDTNSSARKNVIVHPHELLSNKTSSSTQHYFGYNDKGQHLSLVNVLPSAKRTASLQNNNNSNNNTITDMTTAKQQTQINSKNRALLCDYLAQHSQRTVTLVDLCGHERYYHINTKALTSVKADVCMILISPHTGLSPNTIEHISLCIALRLRIIIVVTKIDAFANNVRILKDLRTQLSTFIQQQCNRQVIMIRNQDDVVNALTGGVNNNNNNNIGSNNNNNSDINAIVPIFFISNVTLQHHDLLHHYLCRLQRARWVCDSHQQRQQQSIELSRAISVDALLQPTICQQQQQQVVGNDNNNNTNDTGLVAVPLSQQDFRQSDTTTNITGIDESKDDAEEDTFQMMMTKKQQQQQSLPSSSSIKCHDDGILQPNRITYTQSNPATPIRSKSQFDLHNNNIGINNYGGNTPMPQHSSNYYDDNNNNNNASSSSNVISCYNSALPEDLIDVITSEVKVDDRWVKPNVGVVVSGIITAGEIFLGQKLLLGPINFSTNHQQMLYDHISQTSGGGPVSKSIFTYGITTAQKFFTSDIMDTKPITHFVEFIPVVVNSIQMYRQNIESAQLGDGIGLSIKYDPKMHAILQKNGKYKSKLGNIKELTKELVGKGMVLLGINYNLLEEKVMSSSSSSSLLQHRINTSGSIEELKQQRSSNNNDNHNNHHNNNVPSQQRLVVPYERLLAHSFDIDLTLFHPLTVIKPNFQCVLHASSLSLPVSCLEVLSRNSISEQSSLSALANLNDEDEQAIAKICARAAENNRDTLTLRHNQRGIVRFTLTTPSLVYIHPGEHILLRNGSTVAVGVVKKSYFGDLPITTRSFSETQQQEQPEIVVSSSPTIATDHHQQQQKEQQINNHNNSDKKDKKSKRATSRKEKKEKKDSSKKDKKESKKDNKK